MVTENIRQVQEQLEGFRRIHPVYGGRIVDTFYAATSPNERTVFDHVPGVVAGAARPKDVEASLLLFARPVQWDERPSLLEMRVIRGRALALRESLGRLSPLSLGVSLTIEAGKLPIVGFPNERADEVLVSSNYRSGVWEEKAEAEAAKFEDWMANVLAVFRGLS